MKTTTIALKKISKHVHESEAQCFHAVLKIKRRQKLWNAIAFAFTLWIQQKYKIEEGGASARTAGATVCGLSVFLFVCLVHKYIANTFGGPPIAAFLNEFGSSTHMLLLWVKKALHLFVTHLCRAIFLSKTEDGLKKKEWNLLLLFFWSVCFATLCWLSI